MISVITTNVFQVGLKELKFTVANLANQTHQDFEWVLCDNYYQDNKNIIKELCEKNKIRCIHFPMVGMSHIGSQWHWELYNNALLISTQPYFIRFGIYRYMHKQTLEFVVKSITKKGIYVDQTQQYVTNDIFDFNGDIEEKYNLSILPENITEVPTTHCGMFSMNKEAMIQINGNNEAAEIRHHFEDGDLNARWRNKTSQKIPMVHLKSSFLRIDHIKDLNRPKLDSMEPCFKEYCLTNFHGFSDDKVIPHPEIVRFKYREFPWLACRTCGMMSPASIDGYFKHLETYKSPVAPIGVNGVLGRDIRILNEDINKFQSLDSKVALLKISHTEPRYLHDTEN